MFATPHAFCGGSALLVFAAYASSSGASLQMEDSVPEGLYGPIGEIKAAPGKGRDLAEILLEASSSGMPGNHAWLVSVGVEQPVSLWVSNARTSRQPHDDNLKLPAVQAAFAKARPMIGGVGTRVETKPPGGAGL